MNFWDLCTEINWQRRHGIFCSAREVNYWQAQPPWFKDLPLYIHEIVIISLQAESILTPPRLLQCFCGLYAYLSTYGLNIEKGLLANAIPIHSLLDSSGRRHQLRGRFVSKDIVFQTSTLFVHSNAPQSTRRPRPKRGAFPNAWITR